MDNKLFLSKLAVIGLHMSQIHSLDDVLDSRTKCITPLSIILTKTDSAVEDLLIDTFKDSEGFGDLTVLNCRQTDQKWSIDAIAKSQ